MDVEHKSEKLGQLLHDADKICAKTGSLPLPLSSTAQMLFMLSICLRTRLTIVTAAVMVAIWEAGASGKTSPLHLQAKLSVLLQVGWLMVQVVGT